MNCCRCMGQLGARAGRTVVLGAPPSCRPAPADCDWQRSDRRRSQACQACRRPSHAFCAPTNCCRCVRGPTGSAGGPPASVVTAWMGAPSVVHAVPGGRAARAPSRASYSSQALSSLLRRLTPHPQSPGSRDQQAEQGADQQGAGRPVTAGQPTHQQIAQREAAVEEEDSHSTHAEHPNEMVLMLRTVSDSSRVIMIA